MVMPKPHANDLMAALSDAATAHEKIGQSLLTHAERHANRLAELRKRVEQNVQITAGIARHTSST
jgi:hypothetical protein